MANRTLPALIPKYNEYMKNSEQLNRLADNLKKLREAAIKDEGRKFAPVTITQPTPAQQQAEPQTPTPIVTTPTAQASKTIEKIGTRTRKSELLGAAIERRLLKFKEEIAEFEMKLDKVRKAAKEKEEKMHADVSAKTATAKRLSGVNETLHKEHNELAKRAVAAEAEVKNLNHHLKKVIEDSSAMVADLKQRLAEAQKKLAETPPPAATSDKEKDLAQHAKLLMREVDQLNMLIRERDERLTQMLTPEAIEEVKKVFADAIYNMFAEAELAEPGFITRILANPKIEQESKDIVLEAFKIHDILL